METLLVFKVSCLSLHPKISDKMKETILEKSIQMFTHNGFKAVTMDDIAGELGISKKTIYQHFPSKKELVKSAVDYVYDAAIGKMKGIVGQCKTPIHEHFDMRNCIKELLGHNTSAATIFQFKKYYPRLSERIEKRRYKDLDFTILRNLREGVEQGYYRKEVDIDFIGRMFFSASTSFFHNEEFFEQTEESMEDLELKFTEYHLRGIVTPKGLKVLEELLNKTN